MTLEESIEGIVRRAVREILREELNSREHLRSAKDDLLTIEETAARAKMHVNTIRRAIASGELRASLVGRRYRLRPVDVEAWMNRPRSSKPNPKALAQEFLNGSR